MASTVCAHFVDTPAPDDHTDDDIPSGTTTVIDSSEDKHTHTVIFLHGREDFGSDLAKYFFDSKASDGRTLAQIFPFVRWVFPTAKLRYSAQRDFEFSNSSFADALKGEEIISQWFDIWDIKTPNAKEELMIPGLQESIRDIVGIVREEAQTVPLERIILGGISQGCATAILTLLSSGMELGGFIGWCGWLPFQKGINALPVKCINNMDEISRQIQTTLQVSTDKEATTLEPGLKESEFGAETVAENIEILQTTLGTLSIRQRFIKTPIFLAHSRDDEMVPFTLGEGLHQTIEYLGFDVIWKEYKDGGHWIHPKRGVDDMSTFLREVMDI
ncbi:hypothetical protein EG329_003104 [Mollisiaceae sp. DMI_Dod_QoI]|nr:hypothetical protein EG329_003104 [Helotiales sp. DMI_Dod_QoI]